MTTKRLGILGGALAGTLLLATAGLVAAQDPTPSPSTMGGAGMGAGMMNGQMGAGMMAPDQLEQMAALHDQMVATGAGDPAQMQQLHAQHHPTN